MSNKTLIMLSIITAVGLITFAGVYNRKSSAPTSVSSLGNAALGSRAPTPTPDFSLAKLGGGTITLSEFKGKKPVVVDFWAS